MLPVHHIPWREGNGVAPLHPLAKRYALSFGVRHLYVHVPFCQRRCSYCDFSIAVRKRIPAQEYVEAVLRELDLIMESSTQVRESGDGIETLYLGGGTPSLLPAEAITVLLHELALRFRIPHSALTWK